MEIANPLSIYPRFKPRRSLFYADDLGPLTVMVETDKGITGYGYGGPGTAYVAERHLPKLLVGEDPFEVERLWDIMWRGTLYYGRKGVTVHAISAVDNALWDIVGKALKTPVYKLLGGGGEGARALLLHGQQHRAGGGVWVQETQAGHSARPG